MRDRLKCLEIATLHCVGNVELEDKFLGPSKRFHLYGISTSAPFNECRQPTGERGAVG